MKEKGFNNFWKPMLAIQLYMAYQLFLAISNVSANIEYKYDQSGRLAFAIDDGGDAIIYSYDFSGNVISIINTKVKNLGPPIITEVNPKTINLGEEVLLTITGENFLGGILGIDNPGINLKNTIIAEDSITTILAFSLEALLKPTTITISTLLGSNSATILVKGVLPKITNSFPFSGTSLGGTLVNIFGTHFTNDTMVSIGNSLANNVIFENSTLLKAVIPAATPNIFVNIKASNGNGSSTIIDGFFYTFPFSIPEAIFIKTKETNIVEMKLSEPVSKDLVVNIFNSNTAVITVPESVFIPAGSNSVLIPLSSVNVGIATITFSLGNANKSTNVIVESLQIDTDKDGLVDSVESLIGTDPDNPDTDGDGLLDGDEVNVYRTDPLSKDTDGDGRNDKVETMLKTDPTNKFSFPAVVGPAVVHDHLTVFVPQSSVLPINNKAADNDQLTVLLPLERYQQINDISFIYNRLNVLIEDDNGNSIIGPTFARDQLSVLLPYSISNNVIDQSFGKDMISIQLQPFTNQQVNGQSFSQSYLSVLLQE